MIKDNLVNKVKAILIGIDEDECNSQDGWWETSEGASFGKTKLAEVLAILEALEQPQMVMNKTLECPASLHGIRLASDVDIAKSIKEKNK